MKNIKSAEKVLELKS